MNFKIAIIFFLTLMISMSSVFSLTVDGGDFEVEVDEQRKLVFNDDIYTEFLVEISNEAEISKEFDLSITNFPGWDISINPSIFILEPSQSRLVVIRLQANDEFDYSESIFSSTTIVITRQEDYRGLFNFPLLITTDNDQVVSITLRIEVLPRSEVPTTFVPRFASNEISPNLPIRYTVTGENVYQEEVVSVRVELENEILSNFQRIFDRENDYQIFETQISSEIEPGMYRGRIIIRKILEDGSVREWFEESQILVIPYRSFEVREEIRENFILKRTSLEVTNKGNVPDTFEKEVEVNIFSRVFFSSNVDYNIVDGNIVLSENFVPGESKSISYRFNYIPFYVIIFVILVLLTYVYVRKNSNPLDVETRIYNIKKVTHEGVKALKVRIGFENIKAHEIETLKIIFRMPSYLNVKDNSFLLAPPKQVLKGKTQYKLMWEFRRFEMNDSRIIGFTLENQKGVLGDIRIEDLEIEVKVDGKVRKYYKSFPIVKG